MGCGLSVWMGPEVGLCCARRPVRLGPDEDGARAAGGQGQLTLGPGDCCGPGVVVLRGKRGVGGF